MNLKRILMERAYQDSPSPPDGRSARSLRERAARGDSSWQSVWPFSECDVDRAHDIVEVVLLEISRKPEDRIALSLKPCLPASVATQRHFIVHRTVQLNDHPSRQADEVDDEFTDWVLSSELPSTHLPAPQSSPQPALGAVHVLPQVAGLFGA